ncbi:helix-turn-helix transcriptional regulator [Amycolatopsis rhabdoformis]|uniref:Helix-turn-helix transcriptional regulator n=1 Tax=Amycolatopsis rhabdoformis TaxID=1448059 RepID=A0ABZ1I2U4_9PSEU|nr:helix-turn-helix transcriptional regulator [Amycolatopsis rhabdoformis]WSE28693.1 helix-turn-helix transcriptional regulator [Amycolatopsis rhabdoformis]
MAGTTERDTTAREREIGDELRRLRVRADLTAADLSKRVGFSASKISRMESGARGVTEIDATLFAANCGASRAEVLRLVRLINEVDDGYRLRLLREQMQLMISSETAASEIINYESQLIPGLLQTEGYARAVFHWLGKFTGEMGEAAVRKRLDRQKFLRRPNPPRFVTYIHEEVLRAPVAEPEVMHDQILHLLFASSEPQSVLRVIPTDRCPAGVFGPAFRLLKYPNHKPVVYVENQFTSLYIESPEDLDQYRYVLEKVKGFALDADRSREFLATVASDHEKNRSRLFGSPVEPVRRGQESLHE